MKNILLFVLMISTLLVASSSEKIEREKRVKQQLKADMDKEAKYAREQTFYNQDNYNFKGAEVNRDSLDSVPEIEVDDFDMDSVYD